MKPAPTTLTVRADDVGELAGHLRRLTEAHRGWVNLHPEVDEDRVPSARNGMFAWMGSRTNAVSLATWTAPELRRGVVGTASVGLRYTGAPKALPQLRDAGLDGPAGWRILQDSFGRGLVLSIPADEAPETVIRWLLEATVVLTRGPTTGVWTVAVHEGA